jgi:hypothetical protein
MAWERRGKQKFYYHGVKIAGHVVKRYHGKGLEAGVAEALLVLAQAEAAECRAQAEMVRQAVAHTERLCEVSQLVFAASMLCWGFRRQQRHPWSVWENGKRALEGNRTVNGSQTERVG